MMINPEMLEPILRHTEDYAESMLLRRLKKAHSEVSPEVAEAAVEGCIRAISAYLGKTDAFYVFSRAMDAALVPALKTNTSS